MAVESFVSQYVRCDVCGIRHGDGSSEAAMEARVAAVVDGWVCGRGGPGHDRRRYRDYCPKCKPTRGGAQ